MGRGNILERLNVIHFGEGIIQTPHGTIHESAVREWGGTPKQATYTR